MRRDIIFPNQFLPLGCAETVLFVDNDIREVFEFDGLLDQGVRADQNRNFAVRNPFQKLRTRNIRPAFGVYFRRKFATARTGDERDLYRQMFEVSNKRFEMLGGQDFRGAHVGSLEVAECLAIRPAGSCGVDGGGRDKRFAASHITFKQA